MNLVGFTIIILAIILPIQVFAENTVPDSQISKEITDKSNALKIHPILIKWQLSENHDKFAEENNLIHKENTIGVYIYLSGMEFLSSIASEVDIVSSYEKTVFAFVTSEQLDKLGNLDFVEKITLPDLAQTPPVPKPPPQTQEEDKPNYLLWIVIPVMAVGIVVALKYKTSKFSRS